MISCIIKGARALKKNPGDKVWKKFTTDKALCGHIVDVRNFKRGDIRLSTYAPVIKVRGVEYAASPKDVRIKGSTKL